MPLRLSTSQERFAVAPGFASARGVRREKTMVVAMLSDGRHLGRGESAPNPRFGETIDGVVADLEAIRGALASGLDRLALQEAMQPGAARNALDCAFWDLEARRSGKRVWALAGLPEPQPARSIVTIPLGPASAMRARAAELAHLPVIKVLLGGRGDLERLSAVRAGAPGARLIVDANETWSVDDFTALAPEMARLGVSMIEQPLPSGDDIALARLRRPTPVCADESCHDRRSLTQIVGRYDAINVKLDKTGGLTEALALIKEAREAGLTIMLGSELCTSLSIAASMVLSPLADLIDLDAPLLLEQDRPGGLVYDSQGLRPSEAEFWG